MKWSGFVVFACLGFVVASARAADATRPLDYTQRNAPFAPAESVQPEKRTPATHEAVQEKRVTPPTLDKATSPLGDRRATIEVTEPHEKSVQEKNVRAPEKIDLPKSRFDQQRARFSTASDTTKPPTVARYQDSLTAASASNMARFPALKGGTKVRINRFVFRKNGSDLTDAAPHAPITPAAGGSALSK